MFQLSSVTTEAVIRDGAFARTDFAFSTEPGTLCCAATKKYLKLANEKPSMAAIVTTRELADHARPDLGVVVSELPLKAFYEIHNRLVLDHGLRPEFEPRQAASARIHPSAQVAERCIIGENVVISPGAIVCDDTILEDDVFIGPGALVGVEGHFYKQFGNDRVKVEHGGGTHLARGAQVLAGAIVQKTIFNDSTMIGEEVVLGPGTLVAHGVDIGARTILAGGAQVAGFTTIGEDVWIGPSAVISNFIQIGDGASIELGAVVGRSVPAGQRQSGAFATEHKLNLRAHAKLWRL